MTEATYKAIKYTNNTSILNMLYTMLAPHLTQSYLPGYTQG